MPIDPGAHVQAGAERSSVNGADRFIQDRHSLWQCETGARQNGTSSFTRLFDPFPALQTKRRGIFALFVPASAKYGPDEADAAPQRTRFNSAET